MSVFGSVTGILTAIENFSAGNDTQSGCYKLITIKNNKNEITTFVVSGATYILDLANIDRGDTITAYYDTSQPAPAIFPPRYFAMILVKQVPNYNVSVDLFDDDLVSSDQQLKLIIGPKTIIQLTNGLTYTGSLKDNYLIVLYGPSTRSIPAQTTPYRVIVLCK